MKRSMTYGLTGIICLSAVLASPAAAQRGGGDFGRGGRERDAGAAAGAAAVLSEMQMLRVLTASKLPPQTLQKLRDLAAPAHAQLKQGDAQSARELQAAADLLDRSKQAILQGKGLDQPTPEEVTVATTQQRLSSQRQTFLRQLSDNLRTFINALPPDQKAMALNAGLELVRAERTQEAAARLAAGINPAGGDASRSARSLDGLRSASPQQYEREKLQFALRSANIDNWWATPGVFGDRGGNDRGGNDRGRGGDNRGNQTPPNLRDPAIQGRMAPYMRMADQVRNMPAQTYAQSRARLAQQLETARAQERINSPVSEEDALNAIVRGLTSPTGYAALEAKVGGARAGG